MESGKFERGRNDMKLIHWDLTWKVYWVGKALKKRKLRFLGLFEQKEAGSGTVQMCGPLSLPVMRLILSFNLFIYCIKYFLYCFDI